MSMIVLTETVGVVENNGDDEIEETVGIVVKLGHGKE